MKMIKMMKLGIVGLIGCCYLTNGMLLRTGRAARSAYQNPAMRSAALRRARTAPAEEESLPVVQKQTQGWGEWARSFFTRRAPSPVPAVASSLSRPSGYHPFGRTGQRRYYSSLVPTTEPEGPSSVALTEVSEGPEVPGSFEPSLKSKFPYTTEYEIEKLFEAMNQKLQAGRRSDQVTLQDIQKFKNLVTKSGYNPINRQVHGQPSFLAKMLEHVLREEVDNKGNISNKGRQILQECYGIGARFREGEIEEVLKKTGWEGFLKAVIKNIDTVSKDAPLENISGVASQILSLYDFFNIMGFDLTKTYWANAAVNMDAMRDIVGACNRLSKASDYKVFTGTIVNGVKQYANANLLNEQLFYFSPECTIMKNVHLPSRVQFERSPYMDYPIGYGSKPVYENTAPSEILNNARQSDKFVSTFISQAKNAGFFRSEDNILHLPQSYFDEAYNALMYNGRYVKNEPLYRSFMQEYAPDKLQAKIQSGEIAQELFDYISGKIAELNAARKAELARE